MTTEFKVGVLVLVGIAVLFYMSFRVGKFGTVSEGKGYVVSAHFKNAAGLDKKSPVEVAGVQIGRVHQIALDGNMAKVSLLIKNEIKVPMDSKISIKSYGILGDKYLEIMVGQSAEFVKAGDELKNVLSYADYEEIFQNVSVAARNIGETMDQFKGLVGDKEKQSIKEGLSNIKVASTEFKDMVVQNKGNVNKIVSNVATASNKLGPLAEKADSTLTQISTLVKDVDSGKGTLGMLAKDDKLYTDAKDVVATLKSVSSDIEQGKGTLGKLVKDESLYTDAKETIKNVNQFTGNLKDGKLVDEAQKTMKKIQQAAEGFQEQTPITILGTIFGLIF
jgi:phospholipid/cholesterol/gamma-HCH transport system substrate-binding protein